MEHTAQALPQHQRLHGVHRVDEIINSYFFVHSCFRDNFF